MRSETTTKSTTSVPFPTAGGESCPERSAGTSSLSSPSPSENANLKSTSTPKRRCPGTVFRPDYRKHILISDLEAADYMGVSVKTIKKWIWQKIITIRAMRGAFRIDITDLEKVRRRGLK